MFKAIGRVLFWTYERGSWQYDIMCALILAFIFLTPSSIFDGSLFSSLRSPETPAVTPVSEPGTPGPKASVRLDSQDENETSPQDSE